MDRLVGQWNGIGPTRSRRQPRGQAADRCLAGTALGSEERASCTVDALLRDLCLFDEHTWGSSLSVAQP